MPLSKLKPSNGAWRRNTLRRIVAFCPETFIHVLETTFLSKMKFATHSAGRAGEDVSMLTPPVLPPSFRISFR